MQWDLAIFVIMMVGVSSGCTHAAIPNMTPTMTPNITPTMTLTTPPTMTPSVATDGLSTVTIALIVTVILLCVVLTMVLLGIVVFQTLQKKRVRSKQAVPATGGDTLYDEIDEGQIGTAVALRNVSKLQTTTDPDPDYEKMDDSEIVSQLEPSLIVPTAPNVAYYGIITSPASDDVPTGPNAAYGITTSSASDDVATGANAAYGVTNIVDLEAKVNTTTLIPVQKTESEEEEYI